MADLNEEIKTATVKKWDRAYDISIRNTYGKTPMLTFGLERAKLEDGEFSSKLLSKIQVPFNPAEDFPYLSPEDNSEIPAEAFVTLPKHIQLHVILYSLMMSKA